MKIQKFNESVQNWTEDRIQKLYEEESELSQLIVDYLELNHSGVFNDEKQYYALVEYWFEEDEKGLFNVFFRHGGYGRDETINHEFSNNEFKDLLNFMNNPDAYKKSKKYNL